MRVVAVAALVLELMIVMLAVLLWRRWQRLSSNIEEERKLHAERERAQALLLHQARHDLLTGLGNRLLLREELVNGLREGFRHNETLCLFHLGVDGFKAVNDTLGPAAGDGLLRLMAKRLVKAMGDRSLVARIGGDEFAVLERQTSESAGTAAVAEKLLAIASQPFEIDSNIVSLSASVGVAQSPADGTDPDRLLQAASIAMYGAKDEGRRTWRPFAQPMLDRLEERQRLRNDLRTALDRGQLALFYQPIIDVRSGALTGFEALLRWHHPVRGLVMPDEFIPAAEEGGLMVPIGSWVLREACRAASRWPEPLRVAVNISPTQFRAAGLERTIAGCLEESGLAGTRLGLEITETAVLHDSKANPSVMDAVRRSGVTWVLDDFGTGYASLMYLQHFPFRKLKIDRSFVRDLVERGDSQAIVKSVIALATALDMETTAEGVETRSQFDWLVTAGCSEAQGFLFSRPMPGEDVPKFIGTQAGGGPCMLPTDTRH